MRMKRPTMKGLNHATKRLADGRVMTYWYAWKGGPRLAGEPGTPEFYASWADAAKSRSKAPVGTLQAILDAYQNSGAFLGLAERSRADYVKRIRAIEVAFGDLPIGALAERAAVGEIMEWRDRLALRSRRQADYAIAVLALILSWALKMGKVPANPAAGAGKLYRSTRVENVWGADDENAFRAKAPPHLTLAMTLALWTGQRQGDLLRLPWSAYDGERIRLKQRKTGARVSIPVGAPLKAVLAATRRRAVTILTTIEGTSWTEYGFRNSWRTACRRAGITDLTFHDLRGTAVTRLALAGCSEAEIATITGHSLRDVGAILDAHYLKRDDGLGASAIRKREAHEAKK